MTREKAGPVSHGYRVEDGQSFQLKDFDPADSGAIRSKEHAAADLDKGIGQLRDLQTKLAAQRRWALLIVLQGLDAAGKDGVIKHVMSGLNPQGCQASSFRAPSDEDLAHDFLWRAQRAMPERGRIGIFNRSYYEEVLIVRVHTQLLANEGIPKALLKGDVWKQRFADIRAYEDYLAQRDRNPQVLLQRLEEGAAEAASGAARPAGQELEVQRPGRPRARLLGRLHACL